MFESVGARPYVQVVRALALAFSSVAVLCGTASAQTVTLNTPGSQVTDTMIRSGSFANTNHDSGPLLTRRSVDPEWERRTILKFDTQNTIPANAPIASATLTLTVRAALGTTQRPLTAYRIPQPFQEAQATWRLRQGTYTWTTPGGTMAEQVGAAFAGSAVGSKVTIDVTTLVQNTVRGRYDSRYTRVLLLDSGNDAKDSYREYFASEDANPENRPTLTVVLGTAPPPPPPPPPSEPSTSTTLKVLTWNIAQGYATNGTVNFDRVAQFIAQQRPDIIAFNEINRYSASNSQPKHIADRLLALTGETWRYHWVQKWGAATGEGEAVMTRLPIDAVASHLLTVQRSVAMAQVTVNGRNISVFSTHLDHQSSSTRVSQVRQLVTWSGTFPEQRIVAGDFNGWPGTAEYNEMAQTHRDGWAVARAAGTALSFPGNPDGNTRNTRIDYVWASRQATMLTVTSAQVFDLRDASGVRPSDHNPLIVTFEVR
jgi:endonuclease/exonuclease/phosphatase family metal-dependent hydrolase